MNPEQIANLTLSEICETDNISVPTVDLCVNLGWSNIFHFITILPGVKEPDVYVNNYFEEIVPHYSEATFRSHFRMTRDTMAILIEELRAIFSAENINTNNMIVSLEKKTHVTVWMLANYAVTFRECGTLFGLSTGNVHFIFLQICTALCMMRERYIKWPSIDYCEQLADEIFERTQFPGVIGAIDGCHIEIKAPIGNAYDYYNRKQFHSVILQGTCDTSLQFCDIFVGMPGRIHDARVFRLSPLSRQIDLGLIPENMHILADSAYTLHENVLTPFRDNGHLTRLQQKYNKKHSGIRSCIERAFGLLKNKFRRLRYLDMTLIEEIPKVISACCVLHNFIIIHEGYEDGEDVLDNLDDVPVLQEEGPVQFRNGINKRDEITAML